MKVKMHYVYGKQSKVACGKANVFITTNFKEITCKRCLRTVAHKTVKANTQ